MPRTKAAPSRKRSIDEVSEQDVAELVEKAEIEGWTSRIASGTCRDLSQATDANPEGLIPATAVPEHILEPLRALHGVIKERLEHRLTGWGGIGDASGRRRGYGYFAFSPLSCSHFERASPIPAYRDPCTERVHVHASTCT